MPLDLKKKTFISALLFTGEPFEVVQNVIKLLGAAEFGLDEALEEGDGHDGARVYLHRILEMC